VVSVTNPYGRILGFLDRGRYIDIGRDYKCLNACLDILKSIDHCEM
jgi:hypothetical protein